MRIAPHARSKHPTLKLLTCYFDLFWLFPWVNTTWKSSFEPKKLVLDRCQRVFKALHVQNNVIFANFELISARIRTVNLFLGFSIVHGLISAFRACLGHYCALKSSRVLYVTVGVLYVKVECQHSKDAELYVGWLLVSLGHFIFRIDWIELKLSQFVWSPKSRNLRSAMRKWDALWIVSFNRICSEPGLYFVPLYIAKEWVWSYLFWPESTST